MRWRDVKLKVGDKLDAVSLTWVFIFLHEVTHYAALVGCLSEQARSISLGTDGTTYHSFGLCERLTARPPDFGYGIEECVQVAEGDKVRAQCATLSLKYQS